MPKGQFYALAIFVMVRLDTKGVGLKLWGRQRACSQDYPIALDPLLLGEHKHDHDFLFSFPFENAKAIGSLMKASFFRLYSAYIRIVGTNSKPPPSCHVFVTIVPCMWGHALHL